MLMGRHLGDGRGVVVVRRVHPGARAAGPLRIGVAVHSHGIRDTVRVVHIARIVVGVVAPDPHPGEVLRLAPATRACGVGVVHDDDGPGREDGELPRELVVPGGVRVGADRAKDLLHLIAELLDLLLNRGRRVVRVRGRGRGAHVVDLGRRDGVGRRDVRVGDVPVRPGRDIGEVSVQIAGVQGLAVAPGLRDAERRRRSGSGEPQAKRKRESDESVSHAESFWGLTPRISTVGLARWILHVRVPDRL